MSDGLGADEHYCSSCGEVIKKEAEICPNCGVRQSNARRSRSSDSSKKSPGTAVILTFLFVGLGQMYNGQTLRGLQFMAIQLANLLFLWYVVTRPTGFQIGAPIAIGSIIGLWALVDAYRTAKKINAGEIQI